MKKGIKKYNERAKLILDKNIDGLFKNIKGFDISIPGERIKKRRAENIFIEYLERIIDYCNCFIPVSLGYTKEHPFYDLYVNLDLDHKSNNTIRSVSIKKVLELSNDIIITGVTGSGKSTLMKHLFFEILLLEDRYIPLFIELRRVKGEKSIEEFLYKSLGKDLSFTFKEFTYMLDTGKFIFLIDSTDERDLIDSKIFMQNILDLRDTYRDNLYILTARPNEIFHDWHNFLKFEVSPLEKEKAMEIISKLDFNKEIKESFIKIVVENLFESHKSFLSNPLLLCTMILTFIDGGGIPLKMNLFLQQAFTTLYYRHDAMKEIGYKRMMHSKLDISQFKDTFSFFCFYVYVNKEISFNDDKITDILNYSKNYTKLDFDEKDFIVDMLKSTCIIVKDKLGINSYAFTHIVFKHYFVAYFIAHLIKDEEFKKELVYNIFDKEGFEYNLIYEILFDEDSLFLEKEIIVPILEEIKSATQYKRVDIISSFKLFCKFISEKIYNGNKENALDINIDMFLEDLFQKYEKIFSFKKFVIQFIKEKINNADITTYKYFDNLYDEIIFKENNFLPLEIKINTQEFFNKLLNSRDLDNINFSEPEIHSLRRMFLLYFYLMYVLDKTKDKHAYQKKYLERALKSKS